MSSAPIERVPRLPSWFVTASRVGTALLFLYVFLVGIKALESGISAFGGEYVEGILKSVAAPVAGLAAGMLSTVLVQSSSVTTSTMVGLVAAGVLPLETAVPMVMGANIGTTVTNTLASLGHLRQGAYFKRAFAAATVHDFFNLLAVAVLLPLEVAFGVVSGIAIRAARIVGGILPVGEGQTSLIKRAIGSGVDVIKAVVEALGWSTSEAAILLVIGVLLIFMGLWAVTRQMKAAMSGRVEKALNRVLARGAGAPALAVGLVMTIAVQSSSITTSLLVPLAGAGVLTLANAYPVTLGANIGTTITALLAAVATGSSDALVLALAHTTFNVLGVLIFYPMPRLRKIPMALATVTATVATRRNALVAAYVIGLFIVTPAVVLVLS